MSYILDALRRSEQERRQTEPLVLSPGAAKVIELPRRTIGAGAGIALAAIAIFVTLGYIAYVALAPERRASTAATPTITTPNGTAVSTSLPVSDRETNTNIATPLAIEARGPAAGTALAPELKRHPLVAAPESSGARDLAEEAQVEPPKLKAKKQRARAVSDVETAAAPVLITPAASEIPSASVEEPLKFLRGMPTDFQQALPALVVNIHVYAPREAERILYINNRQYRAGDRVREDVRIEEIVEDGAVLSFRGQRFKLPRPS